MHDRIKGAVPLKDFFTEEYFIGLLGVLDGLEHGRACALLLPYVLEFNAEVAEGKLARLARAAGLSIGGDDADATRALIAWVRELCGELGCGQPFAEFGMRREDWPAIIEATPR